MDSIQIDTVIEARWIIPAEPQGLVLEAHAIAIDKGVIQAVLPASDVSRQFSGDYFLENIAHGFFS